MSAAGKKSDMKRVFIITLVFSALSLLNLTSLQADDHQHHQEAAKVRFNEMYKLKGALLYGDYLVVHDDAKKARGEECVLFYKLNPDNTQELVLSFRCEAVQRSKAEKFTIVASRRHTAFDVAEIQEIQFAGSTNAHRVS